MTAPYTFALCTETKLIKASDLVHLSVPLERNAQHCAAIWSLPAPALVIAEDRGALPMFCRPIVFVDNEGDPNVLAQHYWDPVRGGPAGRVYVDHTSGLVTGPYSACESAAHEIVEALVNAMLDTWYPDGHGAEVAGEDADPVQNTYEIEHGNTLWPVANFVTPAWFDLALVKDVDRKRFLASGGKFDYADTLERPFEIGPEGYAVFRRKDADGVWRYWQEFGSIKTLDAVRAAALQHPWSRTKQLLAGVPKVVRPA